PEQRQHAGAPRVGLALPHWQLAFLDVNLVERERKEAHIPIPAGAEPGDDRLVAVACEGTAVIEAHGELLGHGTSKECGLPGNRLGADIIPCTGAEVPDAAATARTAG